MKERYIVVHGFNTDIKLRRYYVCDKGGNTFLEVISRGYRWKWVANIKLRQVRKGD
jgi:hypothetical protein